MAGVLFLLLMTSSLSIIQVNSRAPCKLVDRQRQNCDKCVCKNGTFACDIPKDCISRVLQKLESKKCIPGKTYPNLPNRPPCICKVTGRLYCPTSLIRHKGTRPRQFEEAFLDPDSGRKCSPGVVYKRDCNRCTCSEKQLLHCTTMTCLANNEVLALVRKITNRIYGQPNRTREKTHARRIKPKKPKAWKTFLDIKFFDSSNEDKVLSRTTRRSSNKRFRNKMVTETPFKVAFLSPDHKCEPGVLYREGCNRCTCTQDRRLQCKTMACLSKKDAQTLKKIRLKHEKDYE